MKQVQLNVVSARMADYVATFKNEEDYSKEKGVIADCYTLVTTSALLYGNGTDKMGEWGKLLTLISNYQMQVELFHEEANRK